MYCVSLSMGWCKSGQKNDIRFGDSIKVVYTILTSYIYPTTHRIKPHAICHTIRSRNCCTFNLLMHKRAHFMHINLRCRFNTVLHRFLHVQEDIALKKRRKSFWKKKKFLYLICYCEHFFEPTFKSWLHNTIWIIVVLSFVLGPAFIWQIRVQS